MDNLTMLQKADLAMQDLTNNGGDLLPEQSNAFIRKLIDQPTLLKVCRTVPMNSPQMLINKIGFGTRILRKARPSTALTQAQRSKPTTEQIELNSKEQIAEVRLPYGVVEDTIMRVEAANNEASNTGPAGLRQLMIDMIAERAALDMEEFAILSDTSYTNALDADDQDYLSQTNGWLKLVSLHGNTYDADHATISEDTMAGARLAMPAKYLRNLPALNHIVSTSQELKYRQSYARRSTGLGDAALQGDSPLFAFGSPVVKSALMPSTKALYTDPMNLIFGIQRRVSMEYDKSITSREYIIVVTTRIDTQVEETEAATVTINLA